MRDSTTAVVSAGAGVDVVVVGAGMAVLGMVGDGEYAGTVTGRASGESLFSVAPTAGTMT